MLLLTQGLTCALNLAKDVSDWIFSWRLFHKRAPLWTNPDLDRVRSESRTFTFFPCLPWNPFSCSLLGFICSARWPDFPEFSILKAMVMVCRAPSWWTERASLVFRSWSVGVYLSSFVWSRRVTFCRTWSLLRSSFVKAEYFLSAR